MPIARPRPYTGQNVVCWGGFIFKYDSGGGGGAAGAYTGSLVVPAYCYLMDVQLQGVTLWTGSGTVAAIVGDADDADGFITSTDLKATDLLAGESISIAAGTAMAGGKIGAYVANSQWCKGSGTYGQYATAARTITCTITTSGTATAGETHLLIAYLPVHGREPFVAPTWAAS